MKLWIVLTGRIMGRAGPMEVRKKGTEFEFELEELGLGHRGPGYRGHRFEGPNYINYTACLN